MKAIAAKRVVMLTGTPAVNRPIELFALANRLDPVTFPNRFSFAKRYCAAHHNGFGWDFNGASNLDELQAKLRSTIMIRRLKEEVLTELPPKQRQVIVLPVENAGARRAIRAEVTAFDARQIRIASLRADRELARVDGDKAAYRKAVAALKTAQGGLAIDELANLRRETALAKVPQVIEHVVDLLDGGADKVLLFAHHREVLYRLKAGLAAYSPMSIVGGDSMTARNDAVVRFQNDPTCRVAVLSILAAGVGLTLTAASTVVFAELDWVPGNVSQAEDRAHRIGQRDNVLVHHLVLDGSIDARLAHAIVKKQEVLDKALDDKPETVDADNVDELAAVEERLTEERERAAADLASALAAARAAVDAASREIANRAAMAAQEEMERLEARVERRETTLTERPSSSRVSRKTIEKQAASITAAQVAAVQRGLRALADMDEDRARDRNSVGFNKADGVLGHKLAMLDELSPRYAVVGREICKTYRRQLGDETLSAMGA